MTNKFPVVNYIQQINEKQLANLALRLTGNTFEESHVRKAMIFQSNVADGGYTGKALEVFMK